MNPLLLRLIPVAVSALAGFAIAWGIQGLRITSAEQEFVEYKQEQTRIFQEQKDAADKQREAAAKDYAKAQEELAKSIEAGDAFKRCVAAGKCGVANAAPGVRPGSRSAGAGLSSPGRLNATSTNELSATGESAAPGVVFDCAYTTLQLNHLQADIEAQPGYKE